MNKAKKSFAEVQWVVEDVKSLMPDWTDDQCEEFLWNEQDTIQEMMIERGWQAIESLLGTYKQ